MEEAAPAQMGVGSGGRRREALAQVKCPGILSNPTGPNTQPRTPQVPENYPTSTNSLPLPGPASDMPQLSYVRPGTFTASPAWTAYEAAVLVRGRDRSPVPPPKSLWAALQDCTDGCPMANGHSG